MDIEGLDDGAALKRAKEHEAAQRKEAQKEAAALRTQTADLQTQLDELTNGKHKKDGDIEALEASWQKKLTDQTAASEASMKKVQTALESQMVESVAKTLAADLAGDNHAIIYPHIKSRLRMEIGEDGTPKTRVLDTTGAVSADSVDDLKNFFFTNDAFAPIVVGSKASGSGASGKGGGGGATKKLSDMTATEEAAYANANPDAYDKMVSAEAGATV